VISERTKAALAAAKARGGAWTASAVRRALARVHGPDDAANSSPDSAA
jgi:hypothetical protein